MYDITQISQNNVKLEIWGRAQVQDARPRKSDWKYNLGGCSTCKKFDGAAPPKGQNVVSRKVHQLFSTHALSHTLTCPILCSLVASHA